MPTFRRCTRRALLFAALALLPFAPARAEALLPELPPAGMTVDPRLFGPGVHPRATAVASAGDDVYVAGLRVWWLPRPVAGDVELPGIAVWNAQSQKWAAVPGDFGEGSVTDLEYFDGQIYAAGDFTEIDGQPFPGLARWDGAQWSALGDEVVEASFPRFDLQQGRLFVYGVTKAGALSFLKVAEWDGEQWSKPVADRGDLTSFTILGSETFASITQPFVRMVRHDGNSWSNMPFPSSNIVGYQPRQLCVLKGEIYATGNFRNLAPDNANFVARWNGSAWKQVGEAGETIGNEVFTVACDEDGVSVASYDEDNRPAVKRWDGTSWSVIGAFRGLANGTSIDTISASEGRVHVGGVFDLVGSQSAANVASWNGATKEWTAAQDESGAGAIAITATAASPEGVFAAGILRDSKNGELGGIAKWTNGGWELLGDSGAMSVYLLAPSGKKLFAYGDWLRDDETQRGLSRWNGSSWSAVRKPFQSEITHMQAVRGKLYAAGYFYPVSPYLTRNLGIWDGSRWTFPPSRVHGEINAMAVTDNGNVFVGGYITKVESVPVSMIARWDGSKWHAMGVVDGGSVFEILAVGNAVYVGGEFDAVAGMPADGFAKWENGVWSKVGDLAGRARNLASDGKYLYAERDLFDESSGETALMRWDGEDWERIDQSPPEFVQALAARGGQLFAGGRFASAGGTPSLNIARWTSCDLEEQSCFAIETTTTTTLETSTTSTTTTSTTTTTTTLPPPTTTVTTTTTSTTESTVVTTTIETSTSTVTLPTTTTTTMPSLEICGDADENNEIELSDALVTLRAAVNVGFCRAIVCDVDASGSVTVADALRILRYAVGLPEELTCSE